MMRDDFSAATKELLAKRVGHRCSNPECRQPTSGPQEDPSRAINVGVAAHITAASPGGPRYDADLASDVRSSHENGLWVCQTCAKLVDNDDSRYSVDKLRDWKRVAEMDAVKALEQRRDPRAETNAAFQKAERLMPELVAEMRTDLIANAFRREFVVLKKAWSYWGKGNELVYFYDDHVELDGKLQVLQNLGLIREITYNNTTRYLFAERFVEWLLGNEAP